MTLFNKSLLLLTLFVLPFTGPATPPGSSQPVPAAKEHPGPAILTAARPFPQHTQYRPGSILPSHISRRQLDDSVRSFYNGWKKRYVRKGCTAGEYYIWFEGSDKQKECVSEGQGYGMVITALMAGFDTAAHTIYNGLFHYYRSHPSQADPLLMAWAQKKDCRSLDGSSATDGDMDIAYSLLLADAQWGSAGQTGSADPPIKRPAAQTHRTASAAVDYKLEATRMITSILQKEINQKTFSVLLSASVENDSKDYFDMRSSDFMPAHFRAFRQASGDAGWDKTIDNNYHLFQYLQKTYSPQAGLVPDFINRIGGTVPHAVPAPPHYLETRYDGVYNYNACRMPWRIATDFLLNGDDRSTAILLKVNQWIRTTTNGNPDNISAGYNLAGEDLPKRYYEALCFIAPFAVSAMVDKSNQVWLNHLWDYLVAFPLRGYDYYDNSIRMICMIILSGNYWKP